MTSRRPGLLALLVAWWWALPLAAQEAPVPDAGPIVGSGTAIAVVEGRRVPVPYTETTAGPLFAAGPLLASLGGTVAAGPGSVGQVLSLGETEAVVAAGNPMATVGQEIMRLGQAPRSGDGGLQVPLELVRRLAATSGWEVVWDPASREVRLERAAGETVLVGWNLVHLQGLSTVVLEFPLRPRYRIEERGQRLAVELQGLQAIPREGEPLRGDPHVLGLSFDGSRIVLETAPGTVVEHYEQTAPFRLVFDVYQRQEADPLGIEPAEPDVSPSLPTFVIDPGHGGSETGAIGPSGVHEKQLTLEIARRLQRRLQQRVPSRVVLTRDEDADLPHDTRSAIANQHKADLFISLHLNSSLGTTAHGAETYFLSLEASDAAAAAAARREGEAPRPGGDPDDPMAGLALILWDLAQASHLVESQRFAGLVQRELNESLGLRDRGVKQAPFRVLTGAAMPAVLVELGFLSNPSEEARLQEADYQEQLVEALVQAVVEYQGRGLAEASPAAPSTP